jgi:hypothetical protein
MRGASRLAILVVAVSLVGTSATNCPEPETASYDVTTDCGPAGVATFASGDDLRRGCCDTCRAFVDAAGANAVGLPERGEILTEGTSGQPAGFDGARFVLVGAVPLAGSSPPASVERTCRFTKSGEGTLAVVCEGSAQEAACSGTLARRTAP